MDRFEKCVIGVIAIILASILIFRYFVFENGAELDQKNCKQIEGSHTTSPVLAGKTLIMIQHYKYKCDNGEIITR